MTPMDPTGRSTPSSTPTSSAPSVPTAPRPLAPRVAPRAGRATARDELAFRSVAELPAGVLVFDRRGDILLANRTALTLLGLGEHEALGHPADEVLHSTEGAKLRRLIR